MSSSAPGQGDLPLTRYFGEIRPTATVATSLHREWKHRVARLVHQLGNHGVEHILDQTGTTGLYYDLSFARCRRQMADVAVPPSAERYHALWLAWLDHMALASRALSLAARSRDRALLGCCRTVLTEAQELLAGRTAESNFLQSELSRERRKPTHEP